MRTIIVDLISRVLDKGVQIPRGYFSRASFGRSVDQLEFS